MPRHPVPPGALRAEINVTPLVDVCLVLLILFMVVTPMLGKTAVALPETARPERLPERRAQLTIAVDAAGAVSVGGERVADGELAAALARLHAADPGREVLVAADSRLPYRSVRRVLALLNEARFERAGVLARRRQR
jgi:biopolymer transport protein ExbD